MCLIVIYLIRVVGSNVSKVIDAMIDKKMSYVITFGFDNRSELYTNTITLHIFIHFVVPSF